MWTQNAVGRYSAKYLNFRRDLNIENVLLGISPASICSWPTFRNPVSVPSSKAGGRLWGVPSQAKVLTGGGDLRFALYKLTY